MVYVSAEDDMLGVRAFVLVPCEMKIMGTTQQVNIDCACCFLLVSNPVLARVKENVGVTR